MQLVVHHRPRRLHVRHVEDTRVRSAGKADAEDLTHFRMRSVATREIGRFTELFITVRARQPSADAIGRLLEIDQPDRTLDPHAGTLEVLDQEPFLSILWADHHVGEEAAPLAHLPDRDVCDLAAAHPEVDCREPQSLLEERFGQTHLAIELERTRVNDQRARRRPGLGRDVDDAYPDARSGQP